MTPQFTSAELNHLLSLELADGIYRSPEDALLAGLKVLRESRSSHNEMADRLASLSDGRAVVLEGDGELSAFLDAIDAEVDAELSARSPSDA